MAGRKRRTRKTNLPYAVEPLEGRRLLSYTAEVLIGSPTAPTDASSSVSSSITVLPDQPVTFDVTVGAYVGTAGEGPAAPTGTVTVYEEADTGGNVTSAGGTLVPGADKLSSATVTLPLMYGAQSFVYAEYHGDDSYVDDEDSAQAESNGQEYTPSGSYVSLTFAPTQFAFTQEPSDAAANSAIAPPVTVALEDAGGAADPYFTGAVTLTSTFTGTGTGGTLVPPTSTTSGETYAAGGTYGGTAGQTYNPTLTVTAVNGLAAFPDVELSAAGTYTLGNPDPDPASDVAGDLNAATSTPFTVTGGKLAFGVAPGDGTVKKPLAPAVTVDIENADGSVQSDDSTTVVTLATVGVTGDAPITGNTATVVAGVATFPDLTFATPGFYQLQATDSGGDASVTTPTKFKIAGDTLAFAANPASTDADTPIPLTVRLLDPDGNLVTDAAGSVVLSLNVVAGGVGAVLSGTTTLPFVGGVATFSKTSGPMINVPGTYTLTATEEDTTAGTLAPTNTTLPATTGQFGIGDLHLAIAKQPADADVLDPVPLTVRLLNGKNKLVTTEDAAGVQLSFTAVTGGAGATLGGTTTATFHGGVATFPAAAAPTLDGVGTYTLTAAETAAADPATPVTTRSFTIAGYNISTSPLDKPTYPTPLADTPDQADASTVYNVQLFDADGKAPARTAVLPDLQVTYAAAGGGAVGSGTATATPNRLSTGDVVYQFSVKFPSTGQFTLTYQAIETAGATVAASAVNPTTETVRVVHPALQVGKVAAVAANEDFTLPVELLHPYNDGKNRGLGVTLFPNVGYAAQLSPNTYGGVLGGTPAAAAGGGRALVLVGPMTVSVPGIYTFMVSEVVTPGEGTVFTSSDLTFDPAQYVSAGDAATVVSVAVRVLPDKLVFQQQPAKREAVGVPFGVTVAIEDEHGRVLTDLSAEITGDNGQAVDEVPVAVLTLAGVASTTADLSALAPVQFVAGVATFPSVVINARGLFSIHATEREMDPTTGVLEASLTAPVTGISRNFAT